MTEEQQIDKTFVDALIAEVGAPGTGRRAVVTISGQVDLACAPPLRALLQSLIGVGILDLTLDLGQVDLLDSTGINVLVSSLKRVRTVGGNLTLRSLRPNVLKTLEITGLTAIFAIRTEANDHEGAASANG